MSKSRVLRFEAFSPVVKTALGDKAVSVERTYRKFLQQGHSNRSAGLHALSRVYGVSNTKN